LANPGVWDHQHATHWRAVYTHLDADAKERIAMPQSGMIEAGGQLGPHRDRLDHLSLVW